MIIFFFRRRPFASSRPTSYRGSFRSLHRPPPKNPSPCSSLPAGKLRRIVADERSTMRLLRTTRHQLRVNVRPKATRELRRRSHLSNAAIEASAIRPAAWRCPVARKRRMRAPRLLFPPNFVKLFQKHFAGVLEGVVVAAVPASRGNLVRADGYSA
jgi:hypothetical protein